VVGDHRPNSFASRAAASTRTAMRASQPVGVGDVVAQPLSASVTLLTERRPNSASQNGLSAQSDAELHTLQPPPVAVVRGRVRLVCNRVPRCRQCES
jgi:hypothetical protein